MLRTFKKLFQMEEQPETILLKTDISFLGSQGTRTSRDESAAFIHCSTSPPNYYLFTYGLTSINMDRGGFGHARNGTNFGCVFDGVTSGGKINAYAAQAFTDFMMRWLSDHHSAFCFGADHSVIDLARSALEEASLACNNPVQADGSFQAEGGSATGAFVAFERCSDTTGKLHGASIGDSAVIAVRMKDQRARQLNPVFRKHDRDTGGQVTMCFGVDGPVWAFASEVAVDELIILTTDGFTDNVSPTEMDQVVPLVIRGRIFDSIVPGECGIVSGDHPEQPSADYIRALTRGRTDELASVSCETAARRLFNYVEWVTRTHHREEQEYYELCLRLRAAHGTETAAGLQEQVSGLMATRKASRKVVKTDDAMIVVLRPFHAIAYR